MHHTIPRITVKLIRHLFPSLPPPHAHIVTLAARIIDEINAKMRKILAFFRVMRGCHVARVFYDAYYQLRPVLKKKVLCFDRKIYSWFVVCKLNFNDRDERFDGCRHHAVTNWRATSYLFVFARWLFLRSSVLNQRYEGLEGSTRIVIFQELKFLEYKKKFRILRLRNGSSKTRKSRHKRAKRKPQKNYSFLWTNLQRRLTRSMSKHEMSYLSGLPMLESGKWAERIFFFFGQDMNEKSLIIQKKIQIWRNHEKLQLQCCQHMNEKIR